MRALRHITFLATLLVAPLAPVGCAEGGRPIGGRQPEEAEPVLAPVVRVTNFNWSRVAVHALVDGRTVRLGEVETGHTEMFSLPAAARAIGELELLADLLASDQEYQTGRITVLPGTVIELRIENNLRLSYYTVTGT